MEEPKITSGTVPYIASEIPDDPRDITPEQWEAMKAVDIRTDRQVSACRLEHRSH
ncbi:MAG: hypothetical protein V8S92_06315 [Oscillospiraceae bacterium]